MNDLQGVESTGRTRSINRGYWHLEPLLATLNNDSSSQSIIFKELCRNLQLRGDQSAFAPSAQQQVLAYSNTHLWLKREADDQRLFVVASFSNEKLDTSLPDEGAANASALDILTDETVELSQTIELAPYQVRWLSVPVT